MPEFIRLPSSIINLSQIREITFEGGVVLVHWVGSDNHLVLRGHDAAALLDALERKYGVLSDAAAQYWLDEGPDHCEEGQNLNNIFTSVP